MMILKRFRTRRLDEFEADQMFDGLYTRSWGYYNYLDRLNPALNPILTLDLTVSWYFVHSAMFHRPNTPFFSRALTVLNGTQ